MSLSTIPRTIVNANLSVLRLPLTAVERLARQGRDNAQWAPAILFARLEAGVRNAAGTLLRDEVLLDQARLQESEVAARQRAVAAETEAAERSREASAAFESEQRAAEEQRVRLERETSDKEAKLERERQEAQRALDDRLAREEAAADEASERQERAVRSSGRSAKVRQLDAQTPALAEKKKAAKAKARALELDDAVEATKAARRSSAR